MALPQIPFNLKNHFKAITYCGNGQQQNIGTDYGSNPSPVFDIPRSLRFSAPRSTAFSRTVASNYVYKWTHSFWIKPGNISRYCILRGIQSTGSYDESLLLDTDGYLKYYRYAGSSQYYGAKCSVPLKNTTGWTHVVVTLDSTLVTAVDRVKFYVNGSQVQTAALGMAGDIGYIPQNWAGFGGGGWNLGLNEGLGFMPGVGSYFDGMLSEFYYIHNQSLDASYFGQYDYQYDSWVPKAYGGTYGSNGFYLPFSDNSSLTSGSNVGLGKDFSGNGNYWNTTGFSITPGSTNDSLADTPTNNYTTLMGLETAVSGGGLNFSSSTTYHATPAGIVPKSGIWYMEIYPSDGNGLIGFYSVQGLKYANIGGGTTIPNCYGWYGNTIWTGAGASHINLGITYTAGDTIGLVLDVDNRTGYWYKNNAPVYSMTFNNTDDYTFMVGDYHSTVTSACSVNFGQRPFTYTPPLGASTLCSKNLSFDINAPQYDLAIIKDLTSGSNSWMWTDSVRGFTKYIGSDNIAAEATSTTRVIGRRRGGFQIGTDTSVNTQGNKYIAYAFRAGNTPVANNAGSIPSTVSVNDAAGFSIVTYTSPTGTNVGTVGHGLSTRPNFVITKARTDGTMNWALWHSSLSNDTAAFLRFNIQAEQTSANIWNTGITNAYVGIQAANTVLANSSCVMFCWSERPGYSKMGLYTGNGSADGPFIYTGFKPAMVMIKGISAVTRWVMWDSTRDPINPVVHDIYPSNTQQEDIVGGVWNFDFLSNGFKLREYTGGDTEFNYPGYNFIYVAFAEANTHALSSILGTR